MKKNNSVGLKAIDTFVEAIRKRHSYERILCICSSEFGIFVEFSKRTSVKIVDYMQVEEYTEDSTGEIITGDPFIELDKIEKTFDFIIGDLPINMAKSKWVDETKNISISIRRNWIVLLKSLFLLNDSGLGLFLTEPILWSKEWLGFQERLNEHGFFICGVFNSPEKILSPITNVQPNLILISKQKIDKLFIAEIEDPDDVSLQVDNLINQRNTNNLNEGILIAPNEFRDFSSFKIAQQIEKLKTQYKEYSSYRLADISSEINLGRNGQEFRDKENSIYVPRVGNSPVIATLNNAKLKHQNYIQVVLNKAIVDGKYLELFFKSELGQFVLQSLYSGLVIPHVNKKDLIETLVPIPPLDEQKLLVSTENALIRLTGNIENFRRELSLNLQSAKNIQEKVSELLEQLNLLSGADRILALIRKGESKKLEFKRTFSLDVQKKIRGEKQQHAVLKTLVGFLNTEGGILLIGVSDKGEILGLSEEIDLLHKRSKDKFLGHFKNLIKAKIGEEFYPDIDYHIAVVGNEEILFVNCQSAQRPCYLEGKDFYVRTNPATDLLEGRKLVEYVERRFKKTHAG